MFKAKTVLLITALVTAVAVVVLALLGTNSAKQAYAAPTIVIDAGHGGTDGGVTGAESRVTEAEINLAISFMLEEELISRGFNTVKTRTSEGTAAIVTGEKQQDMEKRKATILSAVPDAVISIHCNKFPSSERRGAQVFFNPHSENGKTLAARLQDSLNILNIVEVGRGFSSLGGDYYILNCSPYPSAIVECGFLSNAEDEKLLLSEDYRKKLVKAIADGLEKFLYVDSMKAR